MILYELRCGADHVFEGWFRSSAGYEEQRAAETVTCPVCGTADIAKAPMAPAVAKRAARPAETVPAPVGAPAAVAAPAAVSGSAPGPVLDPITLLRAVRREIEASFENVGNRFAEEARRIHYGETEARAIFGDATPAESEALADEGIEVVAIPWVPATDS